MYIFFLVLLISYCKGDENVNQIYRFVKVQKNTNNYDLNNVNQIQSDNMIIDMLFNIYSLNQDFNKAWVILLNYSINNINYIKNEDINNENYSNFLTLLNGLNYSMIPDYIDINDFEEPNFNINEIFLNKENKESSKLKYLYNYPFIKFTFSENGILNIYKPNEISNYDFIILIQNINKIIYTNKNTFFRFNSQTENQNHEENKFENYDIEKMINKIYSIYQTHKFCPSKKIEYTSFSSNNLTSNSTEGNQTHFLSWKQYLENKIKEKHFRLTIFKRKLFSFKLTGIIDFDILNDKQSRIKFDIIVYLYNKKYEIFSTNYTGNTTQMINTVINKFGEFGDQIEDIINGTIPNKIKTVITIFEKLNIKSLSKEPIKTLINLFIDNKNLILGSVTNFTYYIMNYSIENYKILKVFLDPLIETINKIIYSNLKFLNFTNHFNNYYFNITNNITKNIYEKISSAYNSEIAQNLVSILNKSIKFSGEVLKNNIDKIKFFEEDNKNNKNDEKKNSGFLDNMKNKIINTNDKIKNTTKNIKTKVSNVTKKIGNKIKNLFN